MATTDRSATRTFPASRGITGTIPAGFGGIYPPLHGVVDN